MAPGNFVERLPTRLPTDVSRCRNQDRQCPAAHHCRRYRDKPGDDGHYAAWDSRRPPGFTHCDGFIPINPPLQDF